MLSWVHKVNILYYGAILWPHNTASPCCLTMLLLPHSVVSPLSFPFVVFPFLFSSLRHTHLLGICIGVSVCLHGPLLTVLGLMRNSESTHGNFTDCCAISHPSSTPLNPSPQHQLPYYCSYFWILGIVDILHCLFPSSFCLPSHITSSLPHMLI